MTIEDRFERFPVFLRATCLEEAAWLLGARQYKFTPSVIYAFPIFEGFQKNGIKPKRKIPENYTLQRIRDEALMFVDIGIRAALYHYGNRNNFIEFFKDVERAGVMIYFDAKVLELGYEQDRDVKDRLGKLRAVKIPTTNFKQEYIALVEPLGITDYKQLEKIAQDDPRIIRPRFTNRKVINKYMEEANLTCGRNFNFPL